MSSNSKRSRSLFSLTCGCKDSKAVSVSVSVSDTSEKSPATTKDLPSSAATDTQTATTTASLSSFCEDDASSNPSFSGLLRQLSELERSVMELAPPIEEEEEVELQGREAKQVQGRREPQGHRHRRCRSESGGRVEESVAVVKESEDPLADFRRSMLQMIVENEIVGGEELRELLHRFLQLNSPRHHEVILKAFAEIWNEVFSGYENTPDLLQRSKSNSRRHR